MNRMASSLRASSSRGRVKWSLRGLAELGEPKLSTRIPTSSTAKLLLHDVSMRLADQHDVCKELVSYLDRDEALTQSKMVKGNVIRAVNNPVMGIGVKHFQQGHGMIRAAKEEAQKNARNLSRLHEDTLQLSYGLLDGNSSVLTRFKDADRHLIFSIFEELRSRHASTVETLADVVIALRHYNLVDTQLDGLIYKFLRGRLGVQLLCDHYVALHKNKLHGGVSVDCLLEQVIDDAVTEAKHICDAHYENTPEVLLVNVSSDASITLIRPWIHHALVELLKNAMAASFETISDTGMSTPPPIHLELSESDEFLSLSVVDQGRGIADVNAAYEFANSSIAARWDRLEEQQSYAMVRSPLQSLGVGLPLSRMLLQHFGGDLELANRDGGGVSSGCTATLHLNKDDEVLEQFPV